MSWIILETNKFQSSANQIELMSSINLQTAASFASCFFLSFSALPVLASSRLCRSEHLKRRWYCLWHDCSQQRWTVESTSASGQWFLFPDAPCTSCILQNHFNLKVLYFEVLDLDARSPLPAIGQLVQGTQCPSAHDWRGGRRRWRLGVRVLVWLFGWMLRRPLCDSCLVLKTTLKTSVMPKRATTLLIAQVAWTTPPWIAI